MASEIAPTEIILNSPEHIHTPLDVASPSSELALWWVGLQIEDAELRNASEEELAYLKLGRELIEAEFIEREHDRGATRNRLKGLMRHRLRVHNLLNQPHPNVYIYRLATEARWGLSGHNPADHLRQDREGIEDAWRDAAAAEKKRREAEANREDYIRAAKNLLNGEES